MLSDSVSGGDARIPQSGLVQGDLARQHQDGRAPRLAGQRADDFAVQRLVVEPALAGDDELGGGDVVGQVRVLGDDRGPGCAAAAQCQQARAQAARGACAGLVADGVARPPR